MIADIISAIVEEAIDWWIDRRDEKRRAKDQSAVEKKGEDTHEDR